MNDVQVTVVLSAVYQAFILVVQSMAKTFLGPSGFSRCSASKWPLGGNQCSAIPVFRT